MLDILDALIKTLNTIEVKGKVNIDALLGCIVTLEQLRGMVESRTETVTIGGEQKDDHHDEQGQDI